MSHEVVKANLRNGRLHPRISWLLLFLADNITGGGKNNLLEASKLLAIPRHERVKARGELDFKMPISLESDPQAERTRAAVEVRGPGGGRSKFNANRRRERRAHRKRGS